MFVPAGLCAIRLLRIGASILMLNRRVRKRFGTRDARPWLRSVYAARVPKRVPDEWSRRILLLVLAPAWVLFFVVPVCLVVGISNSFGEADRIARQSLSWMPTPPATVKPTFYPDVFGVLPMGWAFGLVAAFFLLWLFGQVPRRIRETIARVLSVPGPHILVTDRRPPVTLLRSFSDDSLRAPRDGFSSGPFESYVALANWGRGPVLAIGRPGERLPRFGACREYCSDDRWKSRVLELLQQSSRIVMVMGTTHAVAWELQQIVLHGHLHKTVYVIPPDNDVEYRYKLFRARMQSLLGTCDLPERAGNIILVGFNAGGRVRAIAAYEPIPLTYVAAFAALDAIDGAT
jgi:hypothetical protein